jgi:hypothetical protein
VVTVRTPSRKVVGASGSGTGLQRSGAMGNSASRQGAVRQSLGSSFVKRPMCCTVGRMRYSQLRSLLARGAVKGLPESCSA